MVEDKGRKLTAKFAISADAKIGQHELRVRTRNGLSKLFTFWVGPFPNVDEKEPNSSFEESQPIAMNVTVNGVAQNEDVDYFEVNVTEGQRSLRLKRSVFPVHSLTPMSQYLMKIALKLPHLMTLSFYYRTQRQV